MKEQEVKQMIVNMAKSKKLTHTEIAFNNRNVKNLTEQRKFINICISYM